MLSDFLNNGYYQYNDWLWIKDEWEDGGNIELLFTKDIDPNELTYEDLEINLFVASNLFSRTVTELTSMTVPFQGFLSQPFELL